MYFDQTIYLLKLKRRMKHDKGIEPLTLHEVTLVPV